MSNISNEETKKIKAWQKKYPGCGPSSFNNSFGKSQSYNEKHGTSFHNDASLNKYLDNCKNYPLTN